MHTCCSDAGADRAGQRGQIPERGETGPDGACCLPRHGALALLLTGVQELGVSLVENCLQQLKQLKKE